MIKKTALSYVYASLISIFLLESANSSELIRLIPAYNSSGEISFVNFQITGNKEDNGQYIAGFSVENGNNECFFGAVNRPPYIYRRNEPGSVVQRLFKFELFEDSIISFYVDLKDKSYPVSGSRAIDFKLMRNEEIVQQKTLNIENGIASNGTLLKDEIREKEEIAFAYGHYHPDGATLISLIDIGRDYEGLIASVSAELHSCKRVLKNMRIIPNNRINAREILVGMQYATTYVFYGSMGGKPEAYDNCKVTFKLKDSQGVVIKEVNARIRKAGKFISDYDERMLDKREKGHPLTR